MKYPDVRAQRKKLADALVEVKKLRFGRKRLWEQYDALAAYERKKMTYKSFAGLFPNCTYYNPDLLRAANELLNPEAF